MPTQINVVGAVIVNDNRVLCALRGTAGTLPGYWEFPGGKIEPGESPRDALRREISEELDCVVEIGTKVTTTRHTYDFGEVTLTTYWCRLVRGVPRLIEHTEVRWLEPTALPTLRWAPADMPAMRIVAKGDAPSELGPQ